MQKKKSILSTSSIADIIIAIVCVSGMAACLFLFYKDLNMSLKRANDKPVATVYYKYNIAQRRFMDRNLWERLKQASPVYNGDRIRTSDYSQVTAVFADGTQLELYENTLIQLFQSKEETTVNFEQGSITATSATSNKAVDEKPVVPTVLKISANGKTINFNAGTKASISLPNTTVLKSGEKVEDAPVQVELPVAVNILEGDVAINNAENIAPQILKAGETAVITDKAVGFNRIFVFTPSPKVSIVRESVDSFSSEWFWNASSDVTFEFSSDKDFSDIIYSVNFPRNQTAAKISVKTEHDVNLVFWRVAQVPEQIGLIALQDAPKAEVVSEDVASPVEEVAEAEVVQNEPDVESVAETKAESNVENASAQAENKLLGVVPELVSPANKTVLTDSYFETASDIKFVWNEVAGAVSYKFNISIEKAGVKTELLAKTVKKPAFTLSGSEFEKVVDNGNFIWTVIAVDLAGNESSVAKSTFSVKISDLGNVEVDTTDIINAY